MINRKIGLIIRALLLVLSFGLLTEMALTDTAEARAGGRRSFGQRSQPSQPRSPSQQQQPSPQGPMPSAGRGSFMKGLAGGVAGGLLGSMLFSSLGHASGFGGGGGGGIGMLDIILIAGLAFLGWRLWKSRQNRPAMATAGGMPMSVAYRDNANMSSNGQDTGYFAQNTSPVYSNARMGSEEAEDIFFKVQGAWTRRDLSLVKDYVDPDVSRVLEQDLAELKRNNSINKLENISVRRVEIGDAWMENDREFIRVRFTANLLDYTVDETTGDLKEGSTSVPVKFDENWVFAKSNGRNQWQLAGIEQV